MKKINFFLISLTLTIILLAGCSPLSPENNTHDEQPFEQQQEKITQNTSSTIQDDSPASDIQITQQKHTTTTQIFTSENPHYTVTTSELITPKEDIPVTVTETIIIRVDGIEYAIPYTKDATVEDSMRQASALSNKPLYFETKNYPGVGSFITSIQGKEQDTKNGYYWIYSINGQDAKAGISTTIIHQGDIIEWTYESTHI